MAFTRRFGFSKFGGLLGGSITDNSSKFSTTDRDVEDRILAYYETHDHAGGDRLADPSELPVLTLHAIGGQLASASTFYYCVTFVDLAGLETAASAEVAISTASQLEPGGAPALTAIAGGSLAATGYYYATSLTQDTDETDLTPASVISVVDSTNATVHVAFDALPEGATSRKIWRQSVADAGYTLVGEIVDPTATSFDDDGSVAADDCACDPNHGPNPTNNTNSTSSITITAPDLSLVAGEGSAVKAWRIYRTSLSGNYGTNSLVATVTDTVNLDGTGGLVVNFLDTGQPLLQGSPPLTSQTILPSPQIPASHISATSDGHDVAHGSTVQDQLDELDEKFSSVAATGPIYVTSDGGYRMELHSHDDGTAYFVRVPGPPFAPTAVTGVPADSAVDLSWTAGDDNLDAITSYVVTTSPGGATFTTPDATPTAHITGLTNGTAYTFSVHAVNAIGNSAEATSAPVTPGTPLAPTGVGATAGDGSITVTWSP